MPNENNQDIRRRPEGALFRTYLSAAGIAPESFSKPLIGVATASTQVFSEKSDARDLGNAVVSGIESGGGIAVRWDTVRSPEMMAWGHAEAYTFAWRDQLADLIESWTKQENLEGLVLVGDAPETLVGMVMAASRLNLPAIVVPITSQRWEFLKSAEDASKKKGYEDPYDLLSETLFGKKKGQGPTQESELFNKCLLTQDNHSSNAVYLVLEALGLTLPGVSTAQARSTQLKDFAAASGQRIVALVKSALGIRRILNGNAFQNAIRLNAALGGSVDVAVHILALAHEAGAQISLDLFDKISKETPQICNLGGVSEKPHYRMEDLDRAGGVWALMHVLKNQILPNPTVSGRGALELAKGTLNKDPHVIYESRPYKKQSGVGVLKGNLAPNGAVFLLNQVVPELFQAKGPAVIFETEIDAAKALSEGKVKKGSVLVVRGQGPKGGPGLKKLRILPALLESRGLTKFIPVITDGRFTDTPAGLFVSFVSPEGAVKGPLGVLKNGDIIEFDITLKTIFVRLTQTEMQIRLARWQAPESSSRGFLARYSRLVSEAHEGAVLK